MAKSARRALVAVAALGCSSLAAMADGTIGPTVIVGGPGGAQFNAQCNRGDFLVGGYVDYSQDLNSIFPLCQHFEGGKSDDDPYPLGKLGQDAEITGDLPLDEQVICPPNTVVEGSTIVTSGAKLVHSLNFLCRNPLDHNYVGTTWRGPTNGVAASSQNVGCGGDALAIGLTGRSGALIDALGLLCQVQTAAPR